MLRICFQYTTQLSVDAKPQLVLPQGDDSANLVPVQLILVLKAKNQKKINSHRWLFNAIGKILKVRDCIVRFGIQADVNKPYSPKPAFSSMRVRSQGKSLYTIYGKLSTTILI